MNEYELIRKFNLLYDQRHNLDGSIKWLESRGLDSALEKEKLFEANRNITEVGEALKNIANGSTSDRYYNLIRQLVVHLDSMVMDKAGNYLDPNHHLVLKGYLFNHISKSMLNAINGLGVDQSGFKYSREEFDHEPLKDYLKETTSYLQTNKMLPRNYIELFDFVKSLQSQFWLFVEDKYLTYL